MEIGLFIDFILFLARSIIKPSNTFNKAINQKYCKSSINTINNYIKKT